MQRKDELEYILRKSKILKKESKLDPWLCRILITELLFGKKRLSGEAKPIKTVLAYKQILSAHCADTANENDVGSPETHTGKSVSCLIIR